MALDNRLTVYNEQGNPVDYDILASDVKFSPDGKDLPTKLAEMQTSIDEAASQGGIQQETDPTVPSWAKQPNPPTPQQIGAVPSQGYVPLTQAEKDKLDALPTSSELGTQLGTKADKSTTYTKTETDEAIADAVDGLGGGSVGSVSVNGGQPVQPVNGNVNLQGVATEDYVDDAVDDKLTQVVVNEMTGAADIITIDDADLAFIDEDGNIAMRVAEGHVETQHFDSRQVGTNTTAIQQLQQQIAQAGSNVQADVAVKEDSDAAFDISDPNGNVVLRVGNDGHIETKGFNSNEVSSADTFRFTKMSPNCIFHAASAVNGILGNTIASIREAYKKGYRWFEIDSKPCQDNGAILTHDIGQYNSQSDTPYTIYQKSDPTQTAIQVGTFLGYGSTDLAENYTWTPSTYTDGALTAEGKPMETLAQAIWHICHILRCPLEVDRQTLTKAVQLKAFQYAKTLGVEHYLFFEAGYSSNVTGDANGFTTWDEMPSILCTLSANYATDIATVAAYKTAKNNIIFSYPSNLTKDDATLKTVADAVHAVGCYALTWAYSIGNIAELRRWLRAGFDFALTNGDIVNTDI